MSSQAYEALWNDPAIRERIDRGIEQNRKSDVLLRVEDSSGRPLPGAAISIDQTDSAFLFGANIFMYGCYPTPEQNAAYEKAYLDLFNAATVPFYWRDLEPEQGKPRFAADSRPIVRRPPPDAVVAFCKKHNLNMNGHCLVWDFIRWSMPDWYPDDIAAGAALLDKRIREIAQRYGQDIHRWDVVNEALLTRERLERKQSRIMPPNYELLSFQIAQKYFPANTHLMINETGRVWGCDTQAYVSQIRQLLSQGAHIRGVGMQFHMFSDDELRKVLAGEINRPAEFLSAMDAVGQVGLPIHVSEITITALANDRAGQEAQARAACNYYRLWFSHPMAHAITWWNFPDGGAAPGEDKVASGLVGRDFQPKLAYEALHELIHRQWRTQTSATTDGNAAARFRGFHGRYRITSGGRSATLDVPPGGALSATVRLL